MLRRKSADFSIKIPTANSPFNIGVSGHRDLHPDELSRLRGVVADFVAELKRHLPDTEVQIIVGTDEAPDHLVVQAALEQGAHVQSVLPMSLEHENLTQPLIRRSSLLLALWDGEVSQLPGGTADTVLRYLGVHTDGGHGEAGISFVEAGGDIDAGERLVYWVPAARSGLSLAKPAALACYLRAVGDNALQMQHEMPPVLAQQLAALNHYNRDYQKLTAAGRSRAAESLLSALPADVPIGAHMMLEDIDAQYGKADRLAVHYQARSDLLFVLFGWMTFTMGVAYLIYQEITSARVLLFAYVLVLLSSLGLYYVLRGRNWFAKHLTYRVIAETLRAKFYLRLAGVDHRVDAGEILGLSGIDRFHGFGWLNYVLKAVEPSETQAGGSRDEEARRSRCVEETWIESQHRYFSSKVAKLEKSSRRIQRLRYVMFVVILIVIAVLFVFGESLRRDGLGIGMSPRNMMVFVMGFLAVVLGGWELHQGKMATRELLWQYRNQLNHFARARAQLARTNSPRRRNEVLVKLGKDSLMESYLWTIHRYHREHEPAGG